MKAFLVDVVGNNYGVVEAEDKLEFFYDALKTDCIDIVVRTIDGKEFDIVCDDYGLLRDDIKVSAVDKSGYPMLVGNLLFAHHDDSGNMVGISAEDAWHLAEHVGLVFVEKDDCHEGNPVVFDCEYC